MAALFEERMSCAAAIARYKQENGLPVRDTAREEALLERNSARLRKEELKPYYAAFLKKEMELSRAYQEILIQEAEGKQAGS